MHGPDPLGILRAAFEESAHGVVVFGDDAAIHFVNDSASAIFGYAARDLVGQPVSRLLPGLVPSARDDRFWKSTDGSAAIASRTITGLRQDGGSCPCGSISA
jgi:PAS domain S-box-containing protein